MLRNKLRLLSEKASEKTAVKRNPKAAETKAASSYVVNTSTVTVEARLQASAEDMYMFLSDEKRIPMWSRSAAKVSFTRHLVVRGQADS